MHASPRSLSTVLPPATSRSDNLKEAVRSDIKSSVNLLQVGRECLQKALDADQASGSMGWYDMILPCRNQSTVWAIILGTNTTI